MFPVITPPPPPGVCVRRAAKYDAVTGEDPEAGAKVTAEAVAPALAAFLLLWVLTFNLM